MLSIVITCVVILMLGAVIWLCSSIFIYGSGHLTAVIGWILLGILIVVYFLLKMIRVPFGRKLDADSLEKSGEIVGAVAASGGYYISAPANKIVANPGTITGSIGVIMEFTTFQNLKTHEVYARTNDAT